MSGELTALVDGVAEMVRRRLPEPPCAPLAIVSGSGLGLLARMGRPLGSIAYAEIPGLGRGSVAGHEGRWYLLEVDGCPLYCLSGRRHLYEGIGMEEAGLAMRVLARLGTASVILTNAAGGLSARMAVGDLMLIRDHLNLMFRGPQIGGAWADRSGAAPGRDLYDPGMHRVLQEQALAGGMDLKEGIYAGVSGPCYETRAEVRAYQRLGGDAVGMSTVPEALAARAAGLRVAALSLITNSHYHRTGAPCHEEVLQMARLAGEKLKAVLARFIAAAGGPAGEEKGLAGDVSI